MPKRFNLLILAPDTELGQSIIRIINDHFHYLNVAVPTGLYKEGTILPPYQIAMNFTNLSQLANDLSLADVVVSCSPKYSTEEIQEIARQHQIKFVDGCFSYPQAVIEAAFNRLPFVSTKMEAIQTVSGFSLIDFWIISHTETPLPAPTNIDNTWCIDQESVPLDGFSVRHRLEFKRRFSALLFWILSFISRLIYPIFKKSKATRSLSNWTFVGKCFEHNQKYKFKAYAERVDAETLRPDLAMLKIIEGLGINRCDCHEWEYFSKMKVKLLEYTAIPNKQAKQDIPF
ncbi:hypothetical protein TVAG_377940 [Trichomonas vaginalis G3]|uniref:Saccharopine dehydrogenase NADP binding domain-containing protein n=1 Tax=Trichomonas vaginalis (strain ATCC PRA-98 / G3) TaxID=412133 RepID=A2DAY5_TRIV3|nr:hypothetical protein TVAGG3_0517880 [Trichomonas vaginalis G3]EAY22315.1 hypothetical protein TVAG_377940 [Trichomonas vaginalis G3]KAI5518253.1 hypothetical protein TVAGG3_0517880 [Trichomonas vaginalis G3]|eukprot:XP_001583301.1 hypothetical protein [Trichomonas vaginalis G3]